MEATGTRRRLARRAALEETGGRRCAKRRRTVVREEHQHRISSLDLRGRRSVLLKPRIARSDVNLDVLRRRPSSVLGCTSCCSSSTASSEASPLRLRESFDLTRHLNLCNGQSEQITAALIDHEDEASDPESTAEGDTRRISTVESTPSAAELEDFFSAAERDVRRRFSERYNFDVLNDAPSVGRFEWIPLTP